MFKFLNTILKILSQKIVHSLFISQKIKYLGRQRSKSVGMSATAAASPSATAAAAIVATAAPAAAPAGTAITACAVAGYWMLNHTKTCTVRSIYSTMLKIGNNVKDRRNDAKRLRISRQWREMPNWFHANGMKSLIPSYFH